MCDVGGSVFLVVDEGTKVGVGGRCPEKINVSRLLRGGVTGVFGGMTSVGLMTEVVGDIKTVTVVPEAEEAEVSVLVQSMRLEVLELVERYELGTIEVLVFE